MKGLVFVACLLGGVAFGQTNCREYIINEPFDLSNNWFDIGDSEVQVINGDLVLNNAAGHKQNYIYKSLSSNLPDSLWRLGVDFSLNSLENQGTGTQCNVVSLSNNTSNFYGSFQNEQYFDSGQQGIGIVVGSNINTGNISNWHFRIETLFSNERTQHLPQIINLNSQIQNYYLELKKGASNQFEFSVFSDSARTIHVLGSPVFINLNYNLNELNSIQLGTYVPAYYTREISATISDLKICEYAAILDIVELDDDNQIDVFPNPTNSYFTIASKKAFSNYELFSFDGKLVQTGSESIVNVSNLPVGTYLLVIKDEKEIMFSSKIVKN